MASDVSAKVVISSFRSSFTFGAFTIVIGHILNLAVTRVIIGTLIFIRLVVG